MPISHFTNTASTISATSKNTIRALALLLAVSGLPLMAGSASDARAQSVQPVQQGGAVLLADNQVNKKRALRAYANSGYGYCDAKKVAAVWNREIHRAKIIIGRKIVGGLTHLINQDIASTAGRVNCSFQESGFVYNDAVRLSQMWNIGIGQAKDKLQAGASRMGTLKYRLYTGL